MWGCKRILRNSEGKYHRRNKSGREESLPQGVGIEILLVMVSFQLSRWQRNLWGRSGLEMVHVYWGKTGGQELPASRRQNSPSQGTIPHPPTHCGMSTRFTWKLAMGKGGAIRLLRSQLGTWLDLLVSHSKPSR